jgi:hypothetical protein
MQCSGSGSVDTKGGHLQVMLVKVGLASFDGSGTGRSTLLLDRKLTLGTARPCQDSDSPALAPRAH